MSNPVNDTEELLLAVDEETNVIDGFVTAAQALSPLKNVLELAVPEADNSANPTASSAILALVMALSATVV